MHFCHCRYIPIFISGQLVLILVDKLIGEVDFVKVSATLSKFAFDRYLSS